MASKADMLKKGAKKTGHGLFSGMEKLNARETEAETANAISSDIEKQEDETEVVNEKEGSPVKEKDKEVKDVSKEDPVIEQKDEPTVHTDDDSLSRRPVEQKDEMYGNEEKSDVLDEILKDVSSGNNMESIDKAVIKEEASTEVDNIQAAPEDNKMQIEGITENGDEVKEQINITQKDDKKQSKKQNSRYEKDKFLLLDIRGYRDYIEHIAKAANMSATKYIRSLIEQDMEKNKEIYLAHKKLEEMLRGKSGN
jgi:hypothetical protein